MACVSAGWLRHFTRLHSVHPNPVIVPFARQETNRMSTSIFWDNSNIWLVGRSVCAKREPGDEQAFRIHFSHLFEFVRNGRTVDSAFVGGSIPPNNDPLWAALRRWASTSKNNSVDRTQVAR